MSHGLELGYDLFYSWQDEIHFALAKDQLDVEGAYGKVDALIRLGAACKAGPWPWSARISAMS